MTDQTLSTKTVALIDSLKSTTGAYGLANNGSEYGMWNMIRSVKTK